MFRIKSRKWLIPNHPVQVMTLAWIGKITSRIGEIEELNKQKQMICETTQWIQCHSSVWAAHFGATYASIAKRTAQVKPCNYHEVETVENNMKANDLTERKLYFILTTIKFINEMALNVLFVQVTAEWVDSHTDTITWPTTTKSCNATVSITITHIHAIYATACHLSISMFSFLCLMALEWMKETKKR